VRGRFVRVVCVTPLLRGCKVMDGGERDVHHRDSACRFAGCCVPRNATASNPNHLWTGHSANAA
jgi:hypothetical protein